MGVTLAVSARRRLAPRGSGGRDPDAADAAPAVAARVPATTRLAAGVIAAALAGVCSLASTYTTLLLDASRWAAEARLEVVSRSVLPELAEEIVAEREAAGLRVQRRDVEGPPGPSSDPPEIWTQARERWSFLSDQEREDRLGRHGAETRIEWAAAARGLPSHLDFYGTAQVAVGIWLAFALARDVGS